MDGWEQEKTRREGTDGTALNFTGFYRRILNFIELNNTGLYRSTVLLCGGGTMTDEV